MRTGVRTGVLTGVLTGAFARALVGVRVAWGAFWFQRIPGHAFALIRIGFSIAALLTLLEFSTLLGAYYTDDGYFPIAAAREWSAGQLMALALTESLGGLGWAVTLYTALLFSVVLLLMGWWTRFAATSVFVLLLWFQLRNPTYLNGGDEVLRLTAFYLCLGYWAIPARDRVLSLDRRGARAAGVDPADSGSMPAWPLRMIQVQVVLLYLMAGYWKLLGDSWWDGRAVYYAVANPALSRFGVPAGAWTEPIFVTMGVAVAWWEFLFPALVVWRRTRVPALWFGLAVHLGILASMNIGFFSLAILATYPAFLGPEVLDRTIRRGRAAVSSLPGPGWGTRVSAPP